MIQYRKHLRAPLGQFIDCLWHCDSVVAAHAADQILPSANMGIVVNLREDRFSLGSQVLPAAILGGPRTTPVLLDTVQQSCTLGVVFKIGGARPFLRTPANETLDLDVALEDTSLNNARTLREQLLEAQNSNAKFDLMERWLQAALQATHQPNTAVRFAVCELDKPGSTVKQVLQTTGISATRFARLFENEIGMAPKAFSRLARFRRVLRTVHRASEANWIDIALAQGYYDQAHFVHEFRSFSGLTPSQYWQLRGPHLNHVPMLD